MLHQALHVVVLVGFLGAMALAFVGIFMPLLFPERGGARSRGLWGSLFLALVAVLALAAEWQGHRWGWF